MAADRASDAIAAHTISRRDIRIYSFLTQKIKRVADQAEFSPLRPTSKPGRAPVPGFSCPLTGGTHPFNPLKLDAGACRLRSIR